MSSGLSRDQKFFNCSEEHEINYVAGRYAGNEKLVKSLLAEGCKSGAIKNFTHAQVYQYVYEKTGLNPG